MQWSTYKSPPSRWGRLIGGLLLLLMSIAGLFFSSSGETLFCRRTSADEGICELRKEWLLREPISRSFPLSAVRDVRFEERRENKSRYGQTELIDTRGAPTYVGRSTDIEEARATYERVRRFFLLKEGSTLQIEREHAVWTLLFSAALAVGGLVLLISAWRLPRTPARKEASSGTKSRIRWWYALSPETRQTLTFLAVAIVLGAAVQVILLWYADNTQGWLTVQCEYRCRFQGAECLPGGSFQMALDPGTYTIEIWNPDLPESWERQPVEVARGKERVLLCRPAAR